MRHNKCGHEYKIFPYGFLRGCQRCPKCSPKAKTQKQFKQEVYDLVQDEYDVLGEYKNNKTKLLMRHNKCGHEYYVTPNSFLQGSRCLKCFGTPKKTTDQFKQEVFDLVQDEYDVLGEYTGSVNKIKMRHNKCGHEYEIAPNSFLQGSRCLKCFGTPKKTTDQFKKEVFDLVQDEYDVLGEYTGSVNKIKMRHNKCGIEFKVISSNFLHGSRCPKCSLEIRVKNRTKTQEQFKQEMYDLVGNEYDVLGKYINDRTKILIRHNKCGHEYYVKPNNLLQGSKCPKCSYNRTKTQEQFKQEMYDLVGNEYDVLEEYINSRTKILIRHNKCGHEYKVLPNNFLQGSRCPKCRYNRTKKKD